MKTQLIMPAHVAVIMDGNGRWAKQRLMPRSFGHSAGCKRLETLSEYAFNSGVKILSIYALSTENLSRPKDEVEALFNLFREYFTKTINKMLKDGIKLQIMGDISVLPLDIQEEINDCLNRTKNNDKHILNIGINYGGRAEIIKVANEFVKAQKIVTEKEFNDCLYTANLPDPDLIIRTGGEIRLSNFLLYQSAYSELYFTKVYWPDFTNKEFDKAIADFNSRSRRFGKV